MAKSPDAFRTIREVSEWLETPAHVLRFWESKFSQIKPVKRAGGRRYYRPTDMLLIGGIKKLLHQEGMTIKGVSKMLRSDGIQAVQDMSQPLDGDTDSGVIDGTAVPASAPEPTVQDAPPAYLRAVPEPESVTTQSTETPGFSPPIPEKTPTPSRPGLFSAPAPGMPFTASETSPEPEAPVEFRRAEATQEPETPDPITTDVPEDPDDDAPLTASEPLLALLFSASPAELATAVPALQNGIAQLEALRAKQVAG